MTPEEWNSSPWWYTRLLIDGLKEEGVLGSPDEEGQPSGTPTGSPGHGPGGVTTVDLSGPGPIPGGFQTRRVG